MTELNENQVKVIANDAAKGMMRTAVKLSEIYRVALPELTAELDKVTQTMREMAEAIERARNNSQLVRIVHDKDGYRIMKRGE